MAKHRHHMRCREWHDIEMLGSPTRDDWRWLAPCPLPSVLVSEREVFIRAGETSRYVFTADPEVEPAWIAWRERIERAMTRG